MNKDSVIGNLKELKGKLKQEFGHANGQTRTEAEGIGDRIKGKIQKAVGTGKDALKKSLNKLLDA